MDPRKIVLKETGLVAAGQVLCTGLMLAIFALLGRFDRSVVLGGLFGAVIAIANFFFMAIAAMQAADKAEQQNVQGGQATVKSSYLLRMVVIFVVMFALVKSGLCHVIALVLPLVFTRPILSIGEFFRKSGDQKA